MAKLRCFTGPIKILLLAIVMLNIYVVEATASDYQSEIDIKTSPNNFLFKAENIKPGDWIPRSLTIINNGNKSFKYNANVGEVKSTKGLFEELILLVKKDEQILYSGKLNEFEGFSPRFLAKGLSETLYFEIKMPYELGNEFQGATAKVEIIFLAEEVSQNNLENEGENNEGNLNISPPPSDGTVTPEIVSKLPNTATNNFNVLLTGVIVLSVGSIMLLYNYKRFRREY